MIRITSQASKKIQENLLKRGQGIGIGLESIPRDVVVFPIH
jgi:hypothetical protein